MTAVIDHTVQIRLLTRTGAARRLTATLRYRPQDPLAVRVLFPAEASLDGAEAPWVFARELLHAGLSGAAGTGDVRLWPCGRRQVMLELHTPEGVALVELDTGDVRRFLRAAYACVPRGAERTGAPLERCLDELLRGVSG
ncbi:SsgA family sporulation/cell division regulator [Streptomyces sp. JJ36]|uniref:SsgA family sporulation/cell division regulator n=1 Tax=Streptomyces sp. JJ36 TaxID=2736645 RepID=UPI001F1898F0|nr:SsgA family sporulation/cell division regulator [Streptomyces sp. JJ36]MCF6522273.1 SsgA family sporulation/cell division regulator [Streptomyces sp. JJ36]